MKQLFLILSIIYSINGMACLNMSGTNLNGEETDLDFIFYDVFLRPNRSPSKESIAENFKRLREDLAIAKTENTDYIHSNISVYMIYDGDYKAAIDYLHKNVKMKDSSYSFCSNIAVAHELLGNLDSARFYMEKALEINPESHHGSEWIHLAILDAEIAMSKDENWLENHSLFGFSVAKDSFPTDFPSDYDLEKFITGSGYQLHERSFFVRQENQDPIFAQLILLHADAVSLNSDTKTSLQIYQLAADHDSTLQETVNKRIAYIKEINELYGISNDENEKDGGLNKLKQNEPSGQELDLEEEEPKKKKRVIKGLIYYLGAGFVLLMIGMFFFLRKKPKQK